MPPAHAEPATCRGMHHLLPCWLPGRPPCSVLTAADLTALCPAPPAGLVALSLGLASFSLAGLYCNHADLSPRYASVLLGMTNTSGALPGIVGVAFTGGAVRAGFKPGCHA